MRGKLPGKSLLTIINDILDFSKIESGKMDISEVDYEPLSMVYDVANIVMTRLKEKDVELVLDIDPNIPSKLFGDNIRIKQVLLGIGNQPCHKARLRRLNPYARRRIRNSLRQIK